MPGTADRPQLLIVCGAGRSGTSSVAGALKMLGGQIPQPEVPGNSANPRGHFEPLWVVDFHKAVLAEAGIYALDPRPESASEVAEAVRRSGSQAILSSWAETHLGPGLNVVKDPRTVWFHEFWTRAAEDHGMPTTFLTMLRHPAEVVGSRAIHYNAKVDDELRIGRETANLAGWVNVMLTTERQTRGRTRTFVPYPDLISDWRRTMTAIAADLDLDYGTDLSDGAPHEIDEFIDPELRRSSAQMADLDVPAPLREMAEAVWANLEVLVETPDDAAASADNDRIREQYDTLYRHSAAMVMHRIEAEANAAAAAATKVARRAVKATKQPVPAQRRTVWRRLRSRLGRIVRRFR